MKIIINWMGFLGSLLKVFASSCKELIPAHEQLVKDNASNRLTEEAKKS